MLWIDERGLARAVPAEYFTVAHQAQNQATQGRDLSTLAPLRALWARTPDRAWQRRAVGEGVSSCPRAVWEIHKSRLVAGIQGVSHAKWLKGKETAPS